MRCASAMTFSTSQKPDTQAARAIIAKARRERRILIGEKMSSKDAQLALHSPKERRLEKRTFKICLLKPSSIFID